jgi:hypothetical protein
MKALLIFVIMLFGLVQVLHSQDTLLNKPIKTKKFDLTVKYTETEIPFPMLNESNNFDKVYKDCNKITPITDSSFYVYSNSEKVIILYKDINEISFKGKNKKGDGIFLGATGGFFSGLLISALMISGPPRSDDRTGLMYIPIFFIPTFTIIGTTVGWIIGANTYERENFEISKYPEHEKKDRALKLFLKHTINF